MDKINHNYLKYLLLITFFSCAHVPKSRNEISKFSNTPLNEQLRPFVSDGCSKWPNGTRKRPNAWLKCCFDHDMAYWLGGTKKQKNESDDLLKSCVEKSFSNAVAILMYLGVKIGGEPTYRSSYRWGFGWNYDRGYLPVTAKELEYSKTVSPKTNESMSKYLIVPH